MIVGCQDHENLAVETNEHTVAARVDVTRYLAGVGTSTFGQVGGRHGESG